MFMQKSCAEFLEKLAAKDAVPGGGGAAALVGALAAALTSMVCNLTLGKKKYQQVEVEVQEILQAATEVRQELTALVQADADAFAALIQAYKLAKDSSAEQDFRTQTISLKSIAASEVPWQVALACKKVLQLAERVAKVGNTQAISDAAIAALLARASLRSACYNVMINLASITDKSYVDSCKQNMKALKREAFLLEEQVLEKTENILLPV